MNNKSAKLVLSGLDIIDESMWHAFGILLMVCPIIINFSPSFMKEATAEIITDVYGDCC